MNLTTELRSLPDGRPDHMALRAALLSASPIEQEAVVRLAITEGVPAAFAECPVLYEFLRTFLARRLQVHEKEICITGSGRTGFSMRPDRWGQPLTAESDLDLFVVNGSLYERCVEDLERDIEALGPGPDDRRKNYLRKVGVLGFIDSHQVEEHATNKAIRSIRGSMRDLQREFDKIGISPLARGPMRPNGRRKASTVRVYRDWKSAIRQIRKNLARACQQAS